MERFRQISHCRLLLRNRLRGGFTAARYREKRLGHIKARAPVRNGESITLSQFPAEREDFHVEGKGRIPGAD
jgi:hypothetical protein